MKTAKEKNQEINNIQMEKDRMGANDKLYNDSMSKDAEKEAAAPNRSNVKPAYAHSFSNRQPGSSSATTPSNLATPRIVIKYGG